MKTNPKGIDKASRRIAGLAFLFLIASAHAGFLDCYFKVMMPCMCASYSSWSCDDGTTGFESRTEGNSFSRCTNFGLMLPARGDCAYVGGGHCRFRLTLRYCDGSSGDEEVYIPFYEHFEPVGEICFP
jgi:hypothetical protein